MSKRAIITGITGQDGSYLAELLLSKGYEVVGTTRRASAPNFWRIQHLLDRIRLKPADLLDQLSIIRLVDEVRPHAAAAFEEVIVTASELKVRKVSHRGKVAEWTLNPLWVRLDREESEDYGLTKLFLVSRGRRLPIATFLSPQEKEGFAEELAAALGTARRGPTRTVI